MKIKDFLCCWCCCGTKEGDSPRLTKRERTRQKHTTLQTLQNITSKEPQSSKYPTKINPRTQKIDELTDIFKVPDQYKTDADVIAKHGYKLANKIGEGGFAEVFKATHLATGLPVACKKMALRDESDDTPGKKKKKLKMKYIKTELYVMQSAKHPHIVQVVRHFIIETKTQKTTSSFLYIFMQYAPNKTLEHYLKRVGPMEEDMCRKFFAQILSGLVYLHRQNIAHRDLKLNNILLDENEDILISDFGMSRVVEQVGKDGLFEAATYCGTPAFMAPEILEKKKNYDPKAADMWSLGVILYRLFCARNPYKIGNREGLKDCLDMMRQQDWSYDPREPSKQFDDIMHKLLESNPRQRISAEKLTNDVWIRDEYKKVERKAAKIRKKYN